MFIDDTKLKDYNLISPNAIFHNTHPIKEERDGKSYHLFYIFFIIFDRNLNIYLLLFPLQKYPLIESYFTPYRHPVTT